jgi:RNA exonuclease 4
MVGVGLGGLMSKLARVSLVNSYGEPIYDVFVQPSEAVTDYRTHVSGIRASDLEHGYEFSVVQREVASMIKNRILVGHGLVSDLQALCLSHPRHLLRDTAHVKLLCPVRPLPLKRLLKDRLGIEIQDNEHSSLEDAHAALLLYQSIANVWEEQLSFIHAQQQQQQQYHPNGQMINNTLQESQQTSVYTLM